MEGNRRWALLVLLLALATPTASSCGGESEAGDGDGNGNGDRLTIVGDSMSQAVYEHGLIPAFQETGDGSDVELTTWFGGSGEQRRALEDGLAADVVALSPETDVDALVDAGLVAADWHDDPRNGMVTTSVVSFGVRKDNPYNVDGWKDLGQGDIELISPNPETSGVGRWNWAGAWGSQKKQGKDAVWNRDFVAKLVRRTIAQPDSAREALQLFASGKGDVLIGSESQLIQARQRGVDLVVFTPHQNLLIENPVAVTKRGGPTAERFVDFLHGEEAQQVFADYGYRPVLKPVLAANRKRFSNPLQPFTIDYLGGWEKAEERFFDPRDGEVPRLQRRLGRVPGG